MTQTDLEPLILTEKLFLVPVPARELKRPRKRLPHPRELFVFPVFRVSDAGSAFTGSLVVIELACLPNYLHKVVDICKNKVVSYE